MALAKIAIVEGILDERGLQEVLGKVHSYNLTEGDSRLFVDKRGIGYLISMMPQQVVKKVNSLHELYDLLKQLKQYKSALRNR